MLETTIATNTGVPNKRFYSLQNWICMHACAAHAHAHVASYIAIATQKPCHRLCAWVIGWGIDRAIN